MTNDHLYINHPGCQIGIRQNQLTVKKTDGEILCYPLRQIQRITVATLAHFTGAALKTLFEENIPTLFCSPSGHFRGRLTANNSTPTHVKRRARQYQLLAETPSTTCLAAAKSIVRAKMHNQHRILSQGHAVADPRIGDLAEKALQADDVESLRGYEGSAARLYFEQLGHQLHDTGFIFTQRLRPAQDPVNALLSFGYALLQNEFEIAFDPHGIDRFVGFMHSSDGRQPALVLDLMEPFRPLVDRLALKLLKHTFTPDDFTQENAQCRLKEQPKASYLHAWEQQMQEQKHWQGQTSSYRRLIERQVLHWVHVLDGTADKLQAWTLRG